MLLALLLSACTPDPVTEAGPIVTYAVYGAYSVDGDTLAHAACLSDVGSGVQWDMTGCCPFGAPLAYAVVGEEIGVTCALGGDSAVVNVPMSATMGEDGIVDAQTPCAIDTSDTTQDVAMCCPDGFVPAGRALGQAATLVCVR